MRKYNRIGQFPPHGMAKLVGLQASLPACPYDPLIWAHFANHAFRVAPTYTRLLCLSMKHITVMVILRLAACDLVWNIAGAIQPPMLTTASLYEMSSHLIVLLTPVVLPL